LGGPLPDARSGFFFPAALGLVLLVAGILRFYALGVPMLLFEEALVSNAAVHDWGYILRRSISTDAHPPFYYYLTKAVLWVGSSEFTLRFLSAFCGVAAVYVLYRLGERLFSQRTALMAAALLAVHLWHIELSRALRPHALIMLLSMFCFGRLVRFLDAPTRRNLWLLAGADLLVSFWHFNGTLIIGTQIPIIFCAMLLRKTPARLALTSIAANSVSLLLNVVPLLARIGRFPGVSIGSGSMQWTLTRTGENLYELLTLLPLPWMGVAGTVACIAGLWFLWRKSIGAFALFTATMGIPLATLIAARYGIIYSAQHIIFIFPILLLVIAYGLERLLVRSEILVIPILALGCFLSFTKENSKLYTADASMFNHNLCQRSIAESLSSAMTGSSSIAGFYPAYLLDFVNWYFKQDSTRDLSSNAVGPEDRSVDFYLVKKIGFEEFNSERAFGIERLGLPHTVDTTLACGFSINRYALARTPVLAIATLPETLTVTATPEDFFRHVYEAHDLLPYFSPLGDLLYPSRFDAPSSFTFRIKNTTGQTIPSLDMVIAMAKTSLESTFEIFYSFDDEPRRQGLAVGEITPHGSLVLRLGRPQSFTVLDVTIRMLCSGLQPSFYNIPETVRFKSFQLSAPKPQASYDSALPVAVTGLDVLESNSLGDFRWGRGPETAIAFRVDQARQLSLEMDVKSPIAGQHLDILLNGKVIGETDLPPQRQNRNLTVPVQAQPGDNTLALRYRYWNHGEHGPGDETFEKDDPRLLAATFSTLRLVDAPTVAGVHAGTSPGE